MASLLHDSLYGLFDHRPTFAADLLRELLHIDLPPITQAEIRSADLTQVTPTEYRADGVILFNNDDPLYRLAIILEIQLDPDPRKRFTWAEYLTSSRARHQCPTYLIVLCPDARVARWAAEPIPMGHPGYTLTPLVIGPDVVPPVTDPAEVRRLPELAVLSAVMYGQTEKGLDVARAVFEGTAALDREQWTLYRDITYYWLNEKVRDGLKELRKMDAHEWETRMFQGVEEGGFVKGQAKSVVLVLEARGVAIPDDARKRILACRDLDQLTRWVQRAAVIQTLDELFAPPSAA